VNGSWPLRQVQLKFLVKLLAGCPQLVEKMLASHTTALKVQTKGQPSGFRRICNGRGAVAAEEEGDGGASSDMMSNLLAAPVECDLLRLPAEELTRLQRREPTESCERNHVVWRNASL